AEAKPSDLVAVREGDGVIVRIQGLDVHANVYLGVVAGIFRPLAEQAPPPMLPISDAQAAAPVS
ncbi:MAG TPA: hypothetical protein VEA99_01995, partial [Gemmatimonadaceae bacterium]|nr:hypothetical protein [Gemmatimonadaceae bacterium]